jgi:hypothetical protein
VKNHFSKLVPVVKQWKIKWVLDLWGDRDSGRRTSERFRAEEWGICGTARFWIKNLLNGSLKNMNSIA